MLTRLASVARPRDNWWSTLVGEELEVEDLKASASGPPIEATWFVAHPAAQFSCGCPGSALLLSLEPGSSPLPVDNFKDTSEGEFSGIEMERQVAEFMGLALLPVLSDSWSDDRGQSSKKCRRIWPSDLPSADTSFWASKRPLFSVLNPKELLHKGQKNNERAKKSSKEQIKEKAWHKQKAPSTGCKSNGWGRLVQNQRISFPDLGH